MRLRSESARKNDTFRKQTSSLVFFGCQVVANPVSLFLCLVSLCLSVPLCSAIFSPFSSSIESSRSTVRLFATLARRRETRRWSRTVLQRQRAPLTRFSLSLALSRFIFRNSIIAEYLVDRVGVSVLTAKRHVISFSSIGEPNSVCRPRIHPA